MAFVNDRSSSDSNEWKTIDREKNIVLKYIYGGGADRSIEFDLKMDSEIIKIYARIVLEETKNKTNDNQRTYNVTWNVEEVIIPKQLNKKRKKIKTIVKEALKTYGWNGNDNKTNSSKVVFLKGSYS